MTGDKSIGSSPRARDARPFADLADALRDFGTRRRALIWAGGSLITAALLAYLLAGQRDEFATALESASAWVLVVTVLLQIVALVSRSEAWHLTIEAAGGTVERRVL